jgi:hypothetical protein
MDDEVDINALIRDVEGIGNKKKPALNGKAGANSTASTPRNAKAPAAATASAPPAPRTVVTAEEAFAQDRKRRREEKKKKLAVVAAAKAESRGAGKPHKKQAAAAAAGAAAATGAGRKHSSGDAGRADARTASRGNKEPAGAAATASSQEAQGGGGPSRYPAGSNEADVDRSDGLQEATEQVSVGGEFLDCSEVSVAGTGDSVEGVRHDPELREFKAALRTFGELARRKICRHARLFVSQLA